MKKILLFMCVIVTSYSAELKGIALIQSGSNLLNEKETQNLNYFTSNKLYIPYPKNLENRLRKYLGLSITRENIQNIQTVVTAHFEKAGFPFAIVKVPPQEVSNGVLQLVVVESTISKITVEGTRWTDEKLISSYIDLMPGDKINQNQLAKDLDFMSRNPFRDASLIYSPGDEIDTTDLTIVSDDRFPLQVYSGIQNNGVDTTGRNRWFVGATWGKAFGLDHILTYQYTASSNFHKLQAHTLQYLMLLPWKHVINIFGGYTSVHPNLADTQRSDGENGQGSFRYIVPLNMHLYFQHEFSAGFDFKRTNNTAVFSEEATAGTNVNIFQFVFGYKGKYRPGANIFEYEFQLVTSPGQWLPDQATIDYETLRPNANHKWIYGTMDISYLQVFPMHFVLFFESRGQFSTNALLPSEQIGIGGYDTVRGYDEREFNADNGFIFNLELRTPPVGIVRNKKKIDDKFQLLAFFDYGWGSNIKAIPQVKRNETLMGIGPGLRYTIGTYLSIRADWGFRLADAQSVGGAGNRLHFSFLLSY